MKIEVLDITPNSEVLIEKIARVCYNSKARGEKARKAFLSSVIKRGHTSVIEHAKATFLISGVSRALTHQLVRHRIASYTQRSQRYCNETEKELTVVNKDGTEELKKVHTSMFSWMMPETISGTALGDDYIDLMAKIGKFYNKAVEAGVPNEDARYVLPNACLTTIAMTMNFRELRSFIDLRSDSHAQWEIRELSDQILKIMYKEAPTIFGDLYEKYIEKKD